MTPIVNAAAQSQLRRLKEYLPQVALLTGPSGVGLQTIATYLAHEQDFRIITPVFLTKSSTVPQIGIDIIRELYSDTRGKTARLQVVVIDDADKMTLSAQNSFLKLLEEPGHSVRFILTSHRPEKLLPTVRSRSQTFYFAPLGAQETEAFLGTSVHMAAKELAQLKFVAQGLPAEMMRLANDPDYFAAMVQRMSLAKQLLEGNAYERLTALLSAKYDRQSALALLTALASLLTRHPRPEQSAWLSRVLEAYDRIEGGGNLRLQMAAVVV